MLGFLLGFGLAWLVLAFMGPDIFQAVKKGRFKRVQQLVDQKARLNEFDEHDLTPLAYAAGLGLSRITKLLLEGGADPNAIRKNGTTPLMNAAVGGHRKIVSLLLEYGADISVKDKEGNMAENWAENGGHSELASELRQRFRQ